MEAKASTLQPSPFENKYWRLDQKYWGLPHILQQALYYHFNLRLQSRVLTDLMSSRLNFKNHNDCVSQKNDLDIYCLAVKWALNARFYFIRLFLSSHEWLSRIQNLL